MLHGKILRSPHPHARILAVDASAAARHPGVYAVLTPFDVPDGRVAPDLPILDTKVRYVGDEVAAVAAVDEDTAQEALRLIEVSYEPLPFVTDPVESMLSGAPAVHEGGNLVGGKPLTLERGNVEERFAQADRSLRGRVRHSGALRRVTGTEGRDRRVGRRAPHGLEVDPRHTRRPPEPLPFAGHHQGGRAGYSPPHGCRVREQGRDPAGGDHCHSGSPFGKAGKDRAHARRGVRRGPPSPRHHHKAQSGRQAGPIRSWPSHEVGPKVTEGQLSLRLPFR